MSTITTTEDDAIMGASLEASWKQSGYVRLPAISWPVQYIPSTDQEEYRQYHHQLLDQCLRVIPQTHITDWSTYVNEQHRQGLPLTELGAAFNLYAIEEQVAELGAVVAQVITVEITTTDGTYALSNNGVTILVNATVVVGTAGTYPVWHTFVADLSVGNNGAFTRIGDAQHTEHGDWDAA